MRANTGHAVTRKQITILSCGGTISSVVRQGSAGAVPSLAMRDVLGGIPGLDDLDIVEHAFPPIASPHMTFATLADIQSAARQAIANGSRGVVVTQGTDTLEEIAFGLDLVWPHTNPLVVTGAMRNASQPGADGPANLAAALRVAADPAAYGQGVLVVMNDEIHAARYVTKAHSTNPATFASPTLGKLGWVREGEVKLPLRLARTAPLPSPTGRAPAVALLKLGLGDDGRLLPFISEAGYRGLVIEGFGGGHVTRDIAEAPALADLVRQMPVVLATRSGAGDLLTRTYTGFTGSETDLAERGLIRAGALNGQKARVLLTLLLAAGRTRDEIAAAFETPDG